MTVKSNQDGGSKHRKRQKTNRRLESTRTVDDFKRDAELRNRVEPIDEAVNPHYKCSVRTDEIPEVPVNRFLLRCPDSSRDKISKISAKGDKSKTLSSLDKSDDFPGDANDEGKTRSTPKVSKSGRIMKGRGAFRFRTPSPQNSKSKSSDHEKHRHSSTRVYYHQSSRRRSRSRSGSESRSRSRSRSTSRSPRRREHSSHYYKKGIRHDRRH